MADRMGYELLIRGAFKYKLGNDIGRGGDPGGLADADCFSDNTLVIAKIGVAYAFSIYINDVINKCDVIDDENARLDGFLERVLDINSIDGLSDIIDEFMNTVFDRYYTQSDGIVSLIS